MDKVGLEVNDDENLFKFMFCLESAYSLFTRLILAKACEDYKLPDIDFSGFIKNQIRNISFRGDISLLAWAITTRDLIKSMKQKLVKSVFEGDIFYWWEDSYKELSAGDSFLYSPYHRYEKQKAYFSEALADIILTLYKFDFSEIVGDPLGTLYQRYFDKETRKALGEFYTPIEVVKYILDAVGYEGQSIIRKRLLDPACGSGTFLVEALRRYLKASEESADEEGWSSILKRLCNEYCIAGFDIHPFATFMAQMQFMLVLIPAYKKAMEKDPHFVLNRLPIFRTDSLIDETKGESRKVTIEESVRGIRHILIDTSLPVDGGNLKIKMPYDKDVFERAGLLNAQEYFAALQAVFDTVKESAREEKYEVDKEDLERNFKRYLKDKEWDRLVSFFTPYAKHFLQKFKELKATFGDGKLIKSVEDIMLAAILKNYVEYDFVVGNPPYVRTRKFSKEENERFRNEYCTPYGSFDIYLPFIERGIKWLKEAGKFGFITSNKYFIADYGVKLRPFILNNCKISQLVDLSFCTDIFEEPLIYAAITILERRGGEIINDNTVITTQDNKVSIAIGFKNDREILKDILAHSKEKEYLSNDFRIVKISQKRFSNNNDFWFDVYAIGFDDVLEKVNQNAEALIKNFEVQGGFMGFEYHQAEKFIVDSLPPQVEYKKILPPSLISRYRILWGTKTIDIFRRKFEHPYLLFAPEIRNSLWEYFSKPKIVVRGVAKEVSAAYDKEGYALLVNVFGIIQRTEKGDLLYLLGLLNSKLIDFIHKIYFFLARIPEGSLRYPKPFWEQLPIRLPQTLEEQALADEITNKVKQILDKVKLEQKIENFPDEYIKEYRSKGEEFDSINIFFNSNHKTIEPVVEKDIDGRGYNIVIGKKEKPVFLESKVKADYVSAALKGKRAKKDEKKQILIPKSDAIVEEILKKLEEDKARIKSPTVAELEGEINELVYKLYGLNEEDVKVIEDFLRRF